MRRSWLVGRRRFYRDESTGWNMSAVPQIPREMKFTCASVRARILSLGLIVMETRARRHSSTARFALASCPENAIAFLQLFRYAGSLSLSLSPWPLALHLSIASALSSIPISASRADRFFFRYLPRHTKDSKVARAYTSAHVLPRDRPPDCIHPHDYRGSM